MSDLHTHLENVPFWNDLTDEEKELALQGSKVVRYEKGSIITGEGLSCLGMITLLKGTIRVYMVSEEGREITLFKLESGERCVLSASCCMKEITFEPIFSTEAPCEILVIPSHIFAILKNNLHVENLAYEITTERFSTVMWVMQQILFMRFDQRLATYLVEESEKSGCLEIKRTQEQIASDVNSAREVVARMLRQFALDHLIEVRRGKIIIKEMDSLRLLTE